MHVSAHVVTQAPASETNDNTPRNTPPGPNESGQNEVSSQSPRRISEWAAIFEGIETSELSTLPSLRPASVSGLDNSSSNSNEASHEPTRADPTVTVHAGNCASFVAAEDVQMQRQAHETGLALVGNDNFANNRGNTLRRAPRIPDTTPRGSLRGVVDRKAKRKKAKEHAVFRNLKTKSGDGVQESTEIAALLRPGVCEVVPAVESEKKIRNRASVQRCRERKSHYYDRLEDDRRALRKENETLQNIVEDILRCLESNGISIVENEGHPA
jgi:hypothetical protein